MVSIKYMYMALSVRIRDISATEYKFVYRLLLHLVQDSAVLCVKKLTIAK
jgi:hypothetical protein